MQIKKKKLNPLELSLTFWHPSLVVAIILLSTLSTTISLQLNDNNNNNYNNYYNNDNNNCVYVVKKKWKFCICNTIASPYFQSTSRSVTVKKGDTAILQCSVSGDKPINIVWMRSGKSTLNPSTNYKYVYPLQQQQKMNRKIWNKNNNQTQFDYNLYLCVCMCYVRPKQFQSLWSGTCAYFKCL